MSILINKDGRQLGPYTLEQARALVLTGELDPLDWSWPDGATDWIPLKDVPGYVQEKPAPAAISPAKAAAATTAPAGSTAPLPAETELWSGHPSQLLNAEIFIFWGAVLVVGLAVLIGFDVFSQSLFWAGIILGSVTLIALINVGIAYYHLRTIEYIVSTQRVRVISGLFSKEVQEVELFRVKDTGARQPFFLRLFGLGTITILSGDEKEPRLILNGVPDALGLRERLRQEVMTLRQRFGVREVDMM